MCHDTVFFKEVAWGSHHTPRFKRQIIRCISKPFLRLPYLLGNHLLDFTSTETLAYTVNFMGMVIQCVAFCVSFYNIMVMRFPQIAVVYTYSFTLNSITFCYNSTAIVYCNALIHTLYWMYTSRDGIAGSEGTRMLFVSKHCCSFTTDDEVDFTSSCLYQPAGHFFFYGSPSCEYGIASEIPLSLTDGTLWRMK